MLSDLYWWPLQRFRRFQQNVFREQEIKAGLVIKHLKLISCSTRSEMTGEAGTNRPVLFLLRSTCMYARNFSFSSVDHRNCLWRLSSKQKATVARKTFIKNVLKHYESRSKCTFLIFVVERKHHKMTWKAIKWNWLLFETSDCLNDENALRETRFTNKEFTQSRSKTFSKFLEVWT